jgi:hypothetical protein
MTLTMTLAPDPRPATRDGGPKEDRSATVWRVIGEGTIVVLTWSFGDPSAEAP